MTIDEVIKLEDWVEAGDTEDEREVRLEAVRERLFPDGLSDEETERRQEVIEQAKAERECRSKEHLEEEMNKLLPKPATSVLLPTSPQFQPMPKRTPWDWKTSNAYRRGQIHDGTREKLERIKDKAKGSPFFENDFPRRVPGRKR